jgi:nickel transport protein
VRCLPFIFCFIFLTQPVHNIAQAHGVNTTNNVIEATVVTTLHDDGTPLSFADFSVHSPQGGPAFAKGQTDSLGRVVFLPNVPGEWEIKIFAADGHGVVTTIDVSPSESLTLSGQQRQKQNQSQIQKFITGVSLLFGIFGLLVLVQNRKPNKE